MLLAPYHSVWPASFLMLLKGLEIFMDKSSFWYCKKRIYLQAGHLFKIIATLCGLDVSLKANKRI
jgi:hypothetical protein